MFRYSDLLKVNQDFIDVFSAEADRARSGAWQSFIPHKAMENLLANLVQSLERSKPRSLWMHGSYGTGKTFCLFVLKHMLEDPWPEVESYFRAHRLNPDLCKRLQALREAGQGQVVFLSGSGYADSNLKFLATVEQSVKEALRQRSEGSDALATQSLFEGILAKITDTNSLFDWSRAFQQHRAEFEPYATTADQVIEWLANPAADQRTRTHLFGLVAQVMEQHNFVVLDSADRVKQWLKEVTQALNLPWLVIVWDEFTEFFLHGAPLDGLQGLAELSYEVPVYLLIGTHRNPETMGLTRTDQWKKLQDRFVVCPYQMEAVTTYRLMGNVVQMDPELDILWEEQQEGLWDRVRFTARNLTRSEGRQDDLKSLVPLHPYSAFLLSRLSDASLSAANRTLFQFLKGEGEHGYPRFLQEHPSRDNWVWYTADGLWDYFFQPDNVDLADEFRDALNYYYSRADMLTDPDETRVFKAAMLLIALQRAISGEPRLEPTLSNLSQVFAGTRIESEVGRLLGALSNQDLIREVPGVGEGRQQYTIPRGGVDVAAVRRIRLKLPTFRNEMEPSGDLRRQILPTLALGGSLDRRYAMNVASVDEVTSRRERVAPRPKPYEIGVVWVVPLSSKEHREVSKLLADLAHKDKRVIYALMDEPFGEERFGQYQWDMAYQQYYTSRVSDAQNAQYHGRRALDRVRSWLEMLRTATVHVFIGDSQRLVSGVPAFSDTFSELVRQVFPYGPEQITSSGPLYRDSYGPSGASTGLGLRPAGGEYSTLVEALKDDGLWPGAGLLDRRRLEMRPDHPLTRMVHDVVDKVTATDAFGLDSLWGKLQAEPYGVLPSPMGVALLGLLLRDAREGYYYDDGANTRPLDGTRLTTIVDETVKGKRSYTLHRTSPAAKAFCDHVLAIFGLTDVERYPESVRAALRNRLKRLGLPLWALNYDVQAGGRAPLSSVIRLHEIVSSTGSADVVFSQENLEQVSNALDSDATRLKQLVEPRRFEEGMRLFLDSKSPNLLVLANRVGTDLKGVLQRIHALLNEDVWLWQEGDVSERLAAVEAEMQLILALNAISGGASSSLQGAIDAVREIIAASRLPLFVLAEQVEGDTVAAFSGLAQLLQVGSDYPHAAQLAVALSAACEHVREALRSPVQALALWIERHLQQELTGDDIESAYAAIRDLSTARGEEEVRREVSRVLADLASSRLAKEVRAAWTAATGTASPDDWSRAQGIPIGWVLEGQSWSDLLGVVSDPRSATMQRLQWASEKLAELNGHLCEMLTPAQAREALTRIAVGDYQPFVQDAQDFESLHKYVTSRAGADIRSWSRKQVESLGREWVQRAYRERMYPRAAAQVDAIPEKELRAWAKDLVRHPAVGLAIMRRKG